jgi:hypothetical protein
MSHSLVYWTQGLVSRRLMGDGGRIYAMTSSGGDRVSPFYGPVSAAKASLESHCRQLALELAPLGITANAIRAGVTDTPALRKIPGHDRMIEIAREINPHGRLTTPADIGRCLVALSRPETAWMTGNVLRVDGGEERGARLRAPSLAIRQARGRAPMAQGSRRNGRLSRPLDRPFSRRRGKGPRRRRRHLRRHEAPISSRTTSIRRF